MTLAELIDRLEDAREEFGDDAEVRLMTQESWPFENAIRGVTSGAEINRAGGEAGEEAEEEAEEGDSDVEGDAVVYIVEGAQLGYGSKVAWNLT